MKMKKDILLIIGIITGLFFFETPFTEAGQESGTHPIFASTKLRMAQAKAREATSQGEVLKAKLEELMKMAESALVKAKEVLTRTSTEERLAQAALLAGAKRDTPVAVARNLEEWEIKISQTSGIKASVEADKAMKRARVLLDRVNEALSLSADALIQAEMAMEDPDLATTQVETIEILAERAIAIIRETDAEEKNLARKTALAADEAAKADYYSRYRMKREKEEIEIAKIEEKEVPPIRIPRLKGRLDLKEHTVVEGDCLWFIADHYYKDPFKWPIIYESNKDKIKDPHWIYPGQVFIIPELE